jgi:acyl-CoA synthetase (AMP-forming)/AMP-acid ligase II
VLSAGAPVAPAVLERCAQLLAAGAQIHTPYGATEALPISSIGSDEVLQETRPLTDAGHGVCVGRAVAGTDIRIVPITDDAMPRWSDNLAQPVHTIGEIAVRGAQVTAAYYRSERDTRLAKIPTPDGGFYHRMGDLGYLDERGRLWFCGRKSQRVSTATGVFYTIPCEAVFNTHAQVARTALVGVGAADAMRPVLCVEPEATVRRSEYPRIARELLALGAGHEHTAPIRHILFYRSFPVDIRHNAKINREALARWARRRMG